MLGVLPAEHAIVRRSHRRRGQPRQIGRRIGARQERTRALLERGTVKNGR
jgi:hypothetical protein